MPIRKCPLCEQPVWVIKASDEEYATNDEARESEKAFKEAMRWLMNRKKESD